MPDEQHHYTEGAERRVARGPPSKPAHTSPLPATPPDLETGPAEVPRTRRSRIERLEMGNVTEVERKTALSRREIENEE